MIRPESRWWLLTLAVVAVLVGISLLALDRPDVVWEADRAACPHCRTPVELYSSRCAACDQQFDWAPSPDADSPLSPWSLSTLEAEQLREQVHALGDEVAATRVAEALGLAAEDAQRYLAAVGRGRCGYCGGTGLHLGAEEEGEPCPVCLGRKWCIACGGDRRIRLGDAGAGEALETYARGLLDVAPSLALATQRAEARRLNEAFILRHAGTAEAAYLVFWPRWEAGQAVWMGPDADRAGPRPAAEAPFWRASRAATAAVEAARQRLDHVLVALKGD